MSKNVWLKKFLLGVAGGKMLRQLNKSSRDCKKAQMAALQSILETSKDTEFGKKYNFASIRTPEDYRAAVPKGDYETLKPYIERMKKGAVDILFPGKPMMYNTTSGTTKEPKLLPISQKYFKECYGGLSKIWLHSCVSQNPGIFDGHDLSIVSKAVEGYTEDGTPVGSMSGHQYSQIPGFMKDIHCVPYEVYTLDSYEEKYYCICRLALENNMTYGIMGNPSSMMQILRKIAAHAEEMITDIEKGTLSASIVISEPVRKSIEAVIKPNPKRAQELRAILKKEGKLWPKDIWPNLELLNTWKCGNSGLYLQHVLPTLPKKCVVREFAYQASEIRGGIVLANDDLGSVMTCHINYFEFVPEAEMDSANPRYLQAWELEKGKRYNLIVTTASGLYRYDMNDILEVEGWYNQFPKMKFIQKGSGVTSLTGEKLHEEQLIMAVKECAAEIKLDVPFFSAFADFDTSSYHLYAEFSGAVSAETRAAFAAGVEAKLKKFNTEYAAKRDSGRLHEIKVIELSENSWEKYKSAIMARGGKDGQFKLVHLMIDKSKKEIFESMKR